MNDKLRVIGCVLWELLESVMAPGECRQRMSKWAASELMSDLVPCPGGLVETSDGVVHGDIIQAWTLFPTSLMMHVSEHQRSSECQSILDLRRPNFRVLSVSVRSSFGN
jgi:hypothetical protein